ncbi:DUF2845 domain-containing protein [Methylovulum sp.]|uniref:DUF2845 domain-containing protein n=1 Tax=Methylovulum sp. TaxID=1916980 RepID=UPI00261CA138|nr:DUF2845 domain-containing protein [Methylovulum sp.]MDD5124589.1 DUF2845 domain-containing protein [Methylovulum sp.]
MKWFSLIIFLLCVPFSQTAFALRCQHELVKLGDHKMTVSALCGVPETIDRHIERRGASNSAGISRRYLKGRLSYGQNQYREIEVSVEEWVYNFGSTRLRQYLRFENGRLTDIETLGRGD